MCGNESLGSCRHWSIIARTANFHGACDSVALFAIPLFQNADDDYGVEDNEQLCRIPFYLAARLVLPSSCQVKEIAFYGDDGNSSLSAGDDSGTGEEGRQSLGLLVSHSIKDQDVDVYSEELWIIRYDDVVFQHVARSPAARNELTAGLEENLIVKESTINVQPLMGVEGKDDGAVIVARSKCRPLFAVETISSCTHTSRLCPHSAPSLCTVNRIAIKNPSLWIAWCRWCLDLYPKPCRARHN